MNACGHDERGQDGLARSTARMYSSLASVMATSSASRRCAYARKGRDMT